MSTVGSRSSPATRGSPACISALARTACALVPQRQRRRTKQRRQRRRTFDRKIVHRSIHVQPLANAAREPANRASQRRRRPRTRLRPSAPTAVQLGSLTDTPSATSPRWLSCSGGPEGARCTKRHSAPTDENKNDDPASKTAIPRLRPHSSALCHRITHMCPDPLPIRVGDAKGETSDRRLQRAPPRIPGRSNRGLNC